MQKALRELIGFIRRHRLVISIILLLLTVLVVWFYLAKHPEIFTTLKTLRGSLIIAVIIGYAMATIGLAIVLYYSVQLFDKRLTFAETFLLNSYSSVVNFFGPGQGGSGVRAVYLKAKYAIRIRDFVVASLLYYAVYSIFSIIFLFVGAGNFLLAFLATAVTIVVSLMVIARYRRGKSLPGIAKPSALIGIVVGTAIQIIALTAVYYFEVHAVQPNTSIGQAISYTGSANMSLFVALTPGAIGVREALLLFTQSFHHVSTTTIVAAGVIDRAIYIVYLGLLAILIFAVHGRRRLGVKIP